MIVAGVWEARTGNSFGATWTLGFGVFWLSIAGILQFTVPTVGKAMTGPHFYHAFGAYLLLWAGVGVVLTVAARFVAGAVTAVFLLATITLTILGASFLDVAGSSFTTIRHVAGYVGLVDAVLALYVAAALVVADTTGQAVLPLFPYAKPAI
jgi:succinate-acetate transporter protein